MAHFKNYLFLCLFAVFVWIFLQEHSFSQSESESACQQILTECLLYVNKQKQMRSWSSQNLVTKGNGYQQNDCSLKCKITTKEKDTIIRFHVRGVCPIQGGRRQLPWEMELRSERKEDVNLVKGGGKGLPSWRDIWYKSPVVRGRGSHQCEVLKLRWSQRLHHGWSFLWEQWGLGTGIGSLKGYKQTTW